MDLVWIGARTTANPFLTVVETYEAELEKYSKEDNSQALLEIEKEYNEKLDAAITAVKDIE